MHGENLSVTACYWSRCGQTATGVHASPTTSTRPAARKLAISQPTVQETARKCSQLKRHKFFSFPAT